MSGRQTRGRQRIPIRRRENEHDLYATFSKRRRGLYKKASELSIVCGADFGIIVFSLSNNPFSFFSPTMESAIDRCVNPNQQPSAYARTIENHSRSWIENLGKRLDELLETKEEVKQLERYLDEVQRTPRKGWWEQVPIGGLRKEQVHEWKAWFERFRSRVTNRVEVLKNGGSTSSMVQQQNAPNFSYASTATTSAGPSFLP